ncbi:MAG TPA: phosphoglycerate dehydrogenase [Chloroflexota bacterium]|nr:phosphoglycerate dehydrogenase [Chloroflexota bacterium]
MKILICDPIAEDGLALLRQRAQVDVLTNLSLGELVQQIPAYHAVIVRSQTHIGASVIAAGTRLRVIGRAGVGVDNIDVDAASQRGIIVVNAPTAANVAAAEHALALMFALARGLPQADASMKAGLWQRSRFLGIELRGKILGVVGLGHIGAELARRAVALGMQVVAFDPFVTREYAQRLGVTTTTLSEMLAVADFVSIHVPLTQATRGLIGAEELSHMKKSARLVNCARGGIVDESSLADALARGQIAGAGVDVFEEEPPSSSPLLRNREIWDRIVLTPHLGASTEEAQVGAAVEVARQVIAVLNGEPARYAVNAPAILPETMIALAPYVALGEKLGYLYAQLVDGPLDRLEIDYGGEIAEYDTTPIKAAVVKGFLRAATPEHITLVNALLLAKNRGLTIVERKSTTTAESYANLLSVRADGEQFVCELAGTVHGTEPHIVRINQYWVDMVIPSSGYLMFCYHSDRPGMIGSIGSMLGNADVNISFMQVGRRAPRGEAMMVLGLDDSVPDELYQRIVAESDIRAARLAHL